jgi:hypothetical protein
LIARSRASLLNTSYSALPPVAPPASSVAAVSAAGVSKATPSTAVKWASACLTVSRFAVKSVSTSSVVSIVATATRSAAVICWST